MDLRRTVGEDFGTGLIRRVAGVEGVVVVAPPSLCLVSAPTAMLQLVPATITAAGIC